jgi:hypothetical protein
VEEAVVVLSFKLDKLVEQRMQARSLPADARSDERQQAQLRDALCQMAVATVDAAMATAQDWVASDYVELLNDVCR